MFWKDLSLKVQMEAMGHSSQAAGLSFRPSGSLRDLVPVVLGACCCQLQGRAACSQGQGAGRDLENSAVAGVPALPADPSHTHTHGGRSWWDSGAPWAGPALWNVP